MLRSTFTTQLLNLGNVSSSKSRPGTMCDQLTSAALTGQVFTLSLQPLGRFQLARWLLCVNFFSSGAPCWWLSALTQLRT